MNNPWQIDNSQIWLAFAANIDDCGIFAYSFACFSQILSCAIQSKRRTDTNELPFEF